MIATTDMIDQSTRMSSTVKTAQTVDGNSEQLNSEEASFDRMIFEGSFPIRSLKDLYRDAINSGAIQPTAHYK